MAETHPELDGRTWVRQLGGGGSADVHLYRENFPPRDVAVKVLRDPSDVAGGAALQREAAALGAVAGHPAVVELYGVGTARDGRPWLAMEFCPVNDLAVRARQAPLPLEMVLDTMITVASGAEALHRSGYVHRDIKPANILQTRWGRPVLADCGAALPSGAPGANAGFSPAWSPPEQHVGADAHPSQDVWGLAATCWTLLAGRSPFEIPGGDNGDAALMARTRAGAFGGLGRSDCPPQLEEYLRRALALSPTQRTPTAATFAQQLQEIQGRLRLPPTRFEVGAGGPSAPQFPSPGTPAVDDNSTLAASVRVINPSGGAAAEATVLGTGGQGTTATGAQPDAPQAKATKTRERTSPRWVAPLAMLLVAVIAVAITVGVLRGQGLQPTPVTSPSVSVSAEPRDPVAAPPSPVGDATGQVLGDKLVWTWRPSTEPGISYQVSTTQPGEEPRHQRTTFTTLEVPAVSGENCISISAVGKDGRPSEPLEECVTVP